MSETDRRCSVCKAVLPPDTLQGLCPKCLLRAAIEVEDRHLHIRCPHCHHPVEIVDDAPLAEINCPSCGSNFSLVADQTISEGRAETQSIGHFELLENIGAGAFGAVWKARDTELDRTVAVKIPRKGQLSPDETEQFLREARAAAQVRHPNVVSVHEVGRDGDTVYIVSDFVEGVTLAAWLTAKRPSPREAAEICRKIAEALQFAHEKGVIHRDLKPSNIMMSSVVRGPWSVAKDKEGTTTDHGPSTTDYEPMLMDFGLAKREAGEITMTVQGKILGTPAYMSPEQAKGEAHSADARSDIYSLGVILFELLTGEKPFRGAMRMMLHQVINDDPPSPRRLNASIPRDLETITLKCLEKEPGRRYENAAALADDLRRYLGGEAIHARPVSKVERAAKWVKRRPAIAALITLSFLLLVLTPLGVVYYLQRNEALRLMGVAEQQKGEAEAQKKEADRLRARSEWLVYARELDMVDHHWRENNLEAAWNALHRTRWDFRGWEFRHLVAHFTQHQAALDGHKHYINAVAFSPDGKRIASASTDKTVKVWNSVTGELMLTIAAKRSVTSVAFSPDGKRLVAPTGGGHTVVLWDSTKGTQIRVLKGHDRGQVTGVAFSPDGTRIASSGRDNTVRIWNSHTGEQLFVFESHNDFVTSVAFSRDGKRVASGSDDKTVKVWDVVHGKEIFTLKGHARPVFSVAFSPDGKRIASGSSDKTVKIWDSASGEPIDTFIGRTHGVSSVAFSPDGRHIVSGSWDKTLKLWESDSGQLVTTFKGHTSSVHCVAFAPDSKRIVSAGGRFEEASAIRVWDLASSAAVLTLKGDDPFWNRPPVHSVAFSPDGERVVSGSSDKRVKVWHAVTGRRLLTLEGHTHDVTCVAYSPDGKRIVSGGPRLDRDKGKFVGGEVLLWDAATGRLLRTINGRSGGVTDVAFSPDCQRIASASHDKTTIVWDVSTGKELLKLLGHKGNVYSVAFSPDGKRIASASLDHTVKLWDAITGKEIRTLTGHTDWVKDVAFSPDGQPIASASKDGTVKLWDAGSGKEVATLRGHTGWVYSVAFSPENKQIVSASMDHTVRVWDAATGVALLTLRGHSGEVMSVAFDPTGRRIVSGSNDETVMVWDSAAGDLVRPLMGHQRHLTKVGFAADGRIIATDKDSRKVVWDPKTGRLLADQRADSVPTQTVSPDGKYRAVIKGARGMLVPAGWEEQRKKRLAKRLLQMLPTADWHDEQARQCDNDFDCFAEVFHLQRLLALNPKHANAADRLRRAVRELEKKVE